MIIYIFIYTFFLLTQNLQHWQYRCHEFFIDQKICWASVAKSLSPNWLVVNKRLTFDEYCQYDSYRRPRDNYSFVRRLCTNCVTRTATEAKTYPWLRPDRMLNRRLCWKIYIASLLYFMLGKYNILLSTFKCCHEKGKVEETCRYDFRLFQVFFHLFIFIFSPVMSCYPKQKKTEKKIYPDGYWSALWQ